MIDVVVEDIMSSIVPPMVVSNGKGTYRIAKGFDLRFVEDGLEYAVVHARSTNGNQFIRGVRESGKDLQYFTLKGADVYNRLEFYCASDKNWRPLNELRMIRVGNQEYWGWEPMHATQA